LDEEDKGKLDRIASISPDGSALERFVVSKILLIKRKFTKAIVRFVDDDFFARSESRNGAAPLKRESFSNAIRAAYDLRSQYVHTGISFGNIVFKGAGGLNGESQLGVPVVGDETLGTILSRAPTYVGLERIIRFCLLKFAQENGAYAEPKGNNN